MAGGRLPAAALWLVPALWAAFISLLVIVVSQDAQQSFYVAIRGTGIVQYPSSIAASSRPLVHLGLIAAGLAVLGIHSGFLRLRGGSDALSFASMIAFAAGLAGFVGLSPLFMSLLAGSLVVMIYDDSFRLGAWAHVDRRATFRMLSLWVFGLLATLAFAGAGRWVVGGFDGSEPLGSQGWNLAIASSQLLGLVYPVLPELTLVFFFAWAVRLALGGELAHRSWPRDDSQAAGTPRRNDLLGLGLLATGVSLSVFVGLYPYLKSVNPTSTLVGVDVRDCYSYWLQGIPGSTVCGNPGFSLGNERVGALWFLQGLAAVSGGAGNALRVAPAVLGALLAASAYALTYEGTGDSRLAGLSALLSSVSTQVVAGVDAGVLANWLGISIAFLLFAVLLRGMRVKRLVYVVPAFGLFAALLFVHPWTWSVVLVVMVLYLALDLGEAALARKLAEKRLELVMAAVMVALGLGVDLVKTILPSGSGLAVAISTILGNLSPSNLPHVSAFLQESFTQYLGGAQANPVWFVLGLAGILAIPSLGSRFGRVLMIWVGAVGVGVALVGPPGNLLQSRFIYDVPLQILGAIGLGLVVGEVRSVDRSWVGRASNLAAILVVVPVVCLQLSFALDYVGFLYH